MEVLIQTEEQLKKFKARVGKLYDLVNLLAKGSFNDFPILKIISTLLQNISLDISDCEGYSFKKELDEINLKLKEIEACCKYDKWYFINFISAELEFITVHTHMEQIEENESSR